MVDQLFSPVTGLLGTIVIWACLDPLLMPLRCAVYGQQNETISNAVIKGYCTYKGLARLGLGLILLSYGKQILDIVAQHG